MARGTEAKARRKNARKQARQEEAGDAWLNSPNEQLMTPVEQDDDSAEEEEDETELPSPASGSNQADVPPPRKQKKAAAAPASSSIPPKKKKKEIKTLPLIFLCIMLGSTILPALIYASDYFGAFLQKSHVLGNLGYKLGIGGSPKKRVMSFYEKHDPDKIPEVPNIMAKYYGDYPKMIKRLERKYQDYGYFLNWEQDEAPMRLAFDKLEETRDYLGEQFNLYAPSVVKTGARNFRNNMQLIYKKGYKIWKKHLWPILEPVFGVPKGAEAQKRKDAADARARHKGTKSSGTRRKNRDYRDDMEDEH